MKSLLGNFLRSTRAGATSFVAIAISVMTAGGVGFIVDQNLLVDQRDTLKSASDAATIATTIAMRREMANDPDISADDLTAALEPVARRWILMNLQHLSRERYDAMLASLVVEVSPNKDLGSVDVDAQANLGGSLFSAMFASGGAASSGTTKVASGVESRIIPAEVVIAIDNSDSMRRSINGESVGPGNPSRMDSVKRAARDLVAILNPSDRNRKAVGLVPWNALVQLDRVRSASWAEEGWAEYPTSRRYAYTYECFPSLTCVPGDEVQALPSLDDLNADILPEDLELFPELAWFWWGCLDEHRVSSTGQADLTAVSELFVPPSEKAFAQAFFPSLDGWAYECLTPPLPSNLHHQWCYDHDSPGIPILVDPLGGDQVQAVCPSARTTSTKMQPIQPLTTARSEIEAAIDTLQPVRGEGALTHSALGVLWGQRLLSHSWNDVWGGGTHPVDPAANANVGTRKAIVLLTDGYDSVVRVGVERETACTAAKGQGTEIFVVSPLEREDILDRLAASLEACSSKDDNPEGSYVFLDNSDEASLRAAFADIAGQLVAVRRVY